MVTTLAQARQIVAWYRMRWIIEQLFRSMKSDCLRIEDAQMEDANGFTKLAIVGLIAAIRSMQLVMARDGSTYASDCGMPRWPARWRARCSPQQSRARRSSPPVQTSGTTGKASRTALPSQDRPRRLHNPLQMDDGGVAALPAEHGSDSRLSVAVSDAVGMV
jgi:hypothetical protein